jgi:hypothetical protein
LLLQVVQQSDALRYMPPDVGLITQQVRHWFRCRYAAVFIYGSQLETCLFRHSVGDFNAFGAQYPPVSPVVHSNEFHLELFGGPDWSEIIPQGCKQAKEFACIFPAFSLSNDEIFAENPML